MPQRGSHITSRFRLRFLVAVIVPVLVLALGLTVFAGTALRSAAHHADRVSADRQAQEVTLAVNDALDELAQSQAGVAIWNPAIVELRKAEPNWPWIDNNVGVWLNSVFAHDADYILDAADRPVYAMIEGHRAASARFVRVALAARPLIEAVRGRVHIAPNPHERLPGAQANRISTARTSLRAIHATDLVSIDGRPAIMSVMRMIPDTDEVTPAPGHEPLLVSVRYLDANFIRNLVKVQLVAGAHVRQFARLAPGEHGLVLRSSRGQRVGYVVWNPDLPGGAVWDAMAPSAMLALVGFLAALGALIGGIARLMRRDARSLEQLNAAHIELNATHLELQAKEGQAHHLAYHDTLTGLPNRAFFTSVSDQMVAASRGEDLWAIFLVDLDRFKQVNDTMGHLGGDILIQEVAKRLETLTNEHDVVARLGGDEFAILLAGRGSHDEIGNVAGAMVAAIRQPFEILGTNVFIGASIGIACHPICTGDRSELMRKADIAMYRAKAEGRDAYRFFTEDMDESINLRREIEDDLRAAIADKHGLAVHYQPQLNPAGSRIIGFEALLRWQHPTRGLLSPQVFVPIAEDTGLIRELGLWVLREACVVARRWPDLSIAVNLSPVQFRSRDFAREVTATVLAARARPQQIELEVTENILLDDDEQVRRALSALRRDGFRIALDDFGTGYSSLSYLSKFEVDKIKIDRSFTSRLGETDDAAAIIQAVVRLGHAMGLSVTAEGVETDAQHAFLEGAGCNELQGFLFSAAIPVDAIENLLAGHEKAAAA